MPPAQSGSLGCLVWASVGYTPSLWESTLPPPPTNQRVLLLIGSASFQSNVVWPLTRSICLFPSPIIGARVRISLLQPSCRTVRWRASPQHDVSEQTPGLLLGVLYLNNRIACTMYYHGQPVVGIISQFFLSACIRRGRDYGHVPIFNFECSLQPVRNSPGS